MQYRTLGRTNLNVSAIAFGAGPVSGLMTGGDFAVQRHVVGRAVERGVNWFDTAAGYGDGRSEENLGRVLRDLSLDERVYVATKVRLAADQLGDVRGAVERSVERSLGRLGMQRITLLQLHNSLTARRGDEPTSITPGDVLGPGGVLEAMEALRKAGVVRHLGLTGLGQPAAVGEVIQSGSFEAIQTPYNVLDPRAGRRLPSDVEDTDDGDVIGQSARQGLGVLAIRVLAGGALAGQPPSAHTLKTLFFPLALFRRDEQRAVQLGRWLAQQPSGGLSLKEVALRYVLFEPRVASAIIGFANAEEVDEAAASLQAGPLPAELSARLAAAEWRSMGLL